MADPRNPYMPTGLDRLSTMLMALGAGVSNAESRGQSGWAGIGPAAAMYGQANQQANQQAMQYDQWQQQNQMQEEYRKSQQENIRSQIQQREAESRNKMGMTQGVLGALGGGVPGMGVPPPTPTMGPGGDILSRASGAIAGIESAGQADPYAAVGPQTGRGRANGKYQVMDFNVGPWTREILGQEMTPEQFRANPQAQEAVFKGKFGQYLQQTGNPQDAASMWFSGRPLAQARGSRDVLGTTAEGYVDKFTRGMGGASPANAQGQGDATGGGAGGVAEPQLDPQTVQMIRAIAISDPAKAAQMLVEAKSKLKKEDAYEPLTDKNASMYLGPGYDPNKTYQRNKVSGKIEVISERKKLDAYTPIPAEEAKTILGPGFDANKSYQRNAATGEIKPIGGSLVNINNQQESAFTKQVAEQDAKRLGTIQDNTNVVLDTVAKVRSATDLLAQTYTGPGADYANAWYKALGSVGVESARNKADAATAAQAIIAELTPKMRPPGSGATSDFEMGTFGKSLVSMLNLPGGNEKVANYWQRIGDRAIAIQEIAEKHALESKRLTGTDFSKEIKALGPIFTKEEIAEMQSVTKAGGKSEAAVGSVPAAAIDYLRSNPGLAADFDKKYGPGAAAKALGR